MNELLYHSNLLTSKSIKWHQNKFIFTVLTKRFSLFNVWCDSSSVCLWGNLSLRKDFFGGISWLVFYFNRVLSTCILLDIFYIYILRSSCFYDLSWSATLTRCEGRMLGDCFSQSFWVSSTEGHLVRPILNECQLWSLAENALTPHSRVTVTH